MKTTEVNAFSGAVNALGAGIDALFNDTGTQYAWVPLDIIEVKAQIRETFEDDENTLEDLAASFKAQGVLQPILLRPTNSGYELVAGERRFRAAKLAGFELIPAVIREMTDEEAQDAQLAENIHRKNLTQIEEAKKIQRDLDRLGSIEAVLAKHQKSRPWLSKIFSLLSLPEQAKRLMTENVSADVEVINMVKIIEQSDPAQAKALVDDLKKTRGKANARDKAAAVKKQVKQSKTLKTSKGQKTPKWLEEQLQRDAERAGRGGFAMLQVLDSAFTIIFEHDGRPTAILEAMSIDDKIKVEALLRTFYDAGKQDNDPGSAVIQGFRNGRFSSSGGGAFALIAFLHGINSETPFSLLNIFVSVRNSTMQPLEK